MLNFIQNFMDCEKIRQVTTNFIIEEIVCQIIATASINITIIIVIVVDLFVILALIEIVPANKVITFFK